LNAPHAHRAFEFLNQRSVEKISDQSGTGTSQEILSWKPGELGRKLKARIRYMPDDQICVTDSARKKCICPVKSVAENNPLADLEGIHRWRSITH
jgi:hypothetical protein